MKKLYTLAAAAMLALGANAQLYVVGAGDGIAWDAASPMEVALTDGAYSFTVTNLSQFKMSTAYGDWDTFNGGALWADLNAKNIGTALALSASDANIAMPWTGDWTVVVNADKTTATFTTTTAKPEGATKLYLRGGMNDWGTPEEWELSTEDGITYWFDCTGDYTIPANTEFKIADADWGSYNFGASSVIYPDDETPVVWNYNANNGYFEEDYEGTIKCVVNPDAPATYAEVTCYTEVVPHVAEIVDLYLRGTMNEWGAPEAWLMTTTDGVTYTFECAGDTKLPANAEFKVGNSDWSTNFGPAEATTVAVGTEYSWVNNGANATISADFEGTVTLVVSGSSATITFAANSGIANIATENAPAEYFNLQGVRVDNPSNGLYIVRQGSSVSKVLVK